MSDCLERLKQDAVHPSNMEGAEKVHRKSAIVQSNPWWTKINEEEDKSSEKCRNPEVTDFDSHVEKTESVSSKGNVKIIQQISKPFESDETNNNGTSCVTNVEEIKDEVVHEDNEEENVRSMQCIRQFIRFRISNAGLPVNKSSFIEFMRKESTTSVPDTNVPMMEFHDVESQTDLSLLAGATPIESPTEDYDLTPKLDFGAILRKYRTNSIEHITPLGARTEPLSISRQCSNVVIFCSSDDTHSVSQNSASYSEISDDLHDESDKTVDIENTNAPTCNLGDRSKKLKYILIGVVVLIVTVILIMVLIVVLANIL